MNVGEESKLSTFFIKKIWRICDDPDDITTCGVLRVILPLGKRQRELNDSKGQILRLWDDSDAIAKQTGRWRPYGHWGKGKSI